MDRIVVDVMTGEITVVPLTDAEIAALPPPEPPPVPTITRLQALLWLAGKGKGQADVDALIGAVADPTAKLQAQAYWSASPFFHHDNPFIIQLWAGLGIAETTDQAFTEAATL